MLGIQPEHPELHVKRLPDLADADVEAAIGEDIEHCELLRQKHRVIERQLNDI